MSGIMGKSEFAKLFFRALLTDVGLAKTVAQASEYLNDNNEVVIRFTNGDFELVKFRKENQCKHLVTVMFDEENKQT